MRREGLVRQWRTTAPVGGLEIRDWGEPGYQEDGRHGGGYGSLQEGQRPDMAQQAAMVRRVVRFFLRGQGEGLTQQDQTHQQKCRDANTVFARSYAPRLTETPESGDGGTR